MSASLTSDLFISADGYAKGEHSPGYFGLAGPELEAWIAGEQQRPDQHVLMGRRTYEVLAGLPEVARDESYRAMTLQPTTVFSRSLTVADWPGVTVEPGDLVACVRELKESGDRPLRTIGSLSVVRSLVDAALVDRLRLAVFPLLVGPSGAEPWCEGLAEGRLELVDHRVLDGRILLVEYRPTGAPIP